MLLSTDSKSIKYYIKSAIVLIIMFGFRYLPAIDPITPQGMHVLGIFIGLLVGWSTVGIIWPCFAAFIGLCMTGLTDVSSLLAACFGSDIYVMLLCFFAFMTLVSESKVTNVIINWMISLKFLRGKPWLFSFMLILASFVGSFLVGCFVAIFIIWEIIYNLAKKMGAKPYEPYPTVMIIGTTIAAILGTVVFPFRATGAVLATTYTAMSGTAVEAGRFFAFAVPLEIVVFIVYLLVCRFVFRIDVTALKNCINDAVVEKESLKMTAYQKLMIGTLVVVILMLTLPNFMPATWAITGFLNAIGMSGKIMLAIILLCILRSNEKPIMDFNKAAKEGASYETLIMCALIMPLASMLTSDATGIKTFVADLLGPFLTGFGPTMFIVMLLLMCLVLTQVMNNGVICIILMSLLTSMTETLGISATPIAIMLMVFSQLAFCTPVATPMSGIMFANTNWVKAKDLYRYAIVASPFIWLVAIPFGILWGSIVL